MVLVYRIECVWEDWLFRVRIVLSLMIHSEMFPHASGSLRVPCGTGRLNSTEESSLPHEVVRLVRGESAIMIAALFSI